MSVFPSFDGPVDAGNTAQCSITPFPQLSTNRHILLQRRAGVQRGLCLGKAPQTLAVCSRIRTRVVTRIVAWEAQVNHRKTSSPEQQSSLMPQRRDTAKCAADIRSSLGSGIDTTYSDFRIRCCDRGSIEAR